MGKGLPRRVQRAEGKGQRSAAHRGEGPGLQEPKSPAKAHLVLGHLSSRRCFTDEGGRPGGQRPGRAAGTTCPPPSPPRGSPNKQKCGHSEPVPHCLSRPASTLSTRPPPELPRSCRARTAGCGHGAPRTCPHSGKPEPRVTPDQERQKPDRRKRIKTRSSSRITELSLT